MDISCNATCTIQEALSPEECDYDEDTAYGDVFKIGFLLKDKLKVFEGRRVTKNQCCYEQQIINFLHRQVQNREHLQQVVYNILHNDLGMDSQVATRAKVNVATAIRNKVLPIAEDNHWIYLLEIHIDCTTTMRSQSPGPTGEHGYDRLLERIDDDECNICADEFDTPPDIIVTTCHHTFDRSCIMRWLKEQNTKTCPTCRTDLSTMVGSPMDFS
ncbi:hypothetical protein EJ110_NYTH28281 [Nymphaea thermarum]|nr:hypothetical protein EJ110_NYTH28281 [Nymphaea thermarum]